jgi:hypothetical protein
MNAWSNFQHTLAAQFNDNPLIRAVSVSSCSGSTGEPFVVSGAVSSQHNLAQAGWTPTLQENCLSQALNDYSGWHNTQITFAFNSLYGLSSSQNDFMDQLMTKCALSCTDGRPDCALGNNDLSTTITSDLYSAAIYQEIGQLVKTYPKTSVYFYIAGGLYKNLAEDCQTMSLATAVGATSVELWPTNGTSANNGFSVIPTSSLKFCNQTLANHAQINC